jgi:hypothetical protein
MTRAPRDASSEIRIWCKLAGEKYKVVGFDPEAFTFNELLDHVAASLGVLGGGGSLEIIDSCAECGQEESAVVDSIDLIRSRDKFLFLPPPQLHPTDAVDHDQMGQRNNTAPAETGEASRNKRAYRVGAPRAVAYRPSQVVSSPEASYVVHDNRTTTTDTEMESTAALSSSTSRSKRGSAFLLSSDLPQDVELSCLMESTNPIADEHYLNPRSSIRSTASRILQQGMNHPGNFSWKSPQQLPASNVWLQSSVPTSSIDGGSSLGGTTPTGRAPKDQRDLKRVPEDMQEAMEEKGKGTSAGPKIICLSHPDDEKYLTEYHQLLRKQLEIYEFDPSPGERKSTAIGAVGIRCMHCSHLPLYKKRGDAQSYPSKLEYLYDTAVQFGIYHFPYCEQIDSSLRDEIIELRDKKVTLIGRKQFWLDCFRELGLYQASDGLRFSKESGGMEIPGGKVGQKSRTRPAAKRKKPIKYRDDDVTEKSVKADSQGSEPGVTTSSLGQPRVVCLRLEEDKKFLTEYHSLIREHLELFEYQESSCGKVSLPGRGDPVPGVVGLRCNRCFDLPSYQKAGLAVTFPSKLGLVYDSAMRVASEHLPYCQAVEEDVKERFRILKDKKVKLTGRRQYWFDCLVKLGLSQTQDGLRFTSVEE